jgi:hypothetical protein
MPSTDIDDDAEKMLSHCTSFQTSDPHNRHHVLPSKSGTEHLVESISKNINGTMLSACFAPFSSSTF